ncbi:MAG: DNA polymerase III subunit alpha, partial [Candidatus Kerfeldbacteria bacterium]|nr:DNA polymerase III subunit alpha [Candidatus Kerfeldbacteria bacterium]
ARDIAGFTMAEADVLRKAVGKKIASLLKEQREKFVEGAVANKIPRKTAEQLFSFIEPFARYGFNRAHAACYGLIAYQTAYFKANFPAEFMAALLTSDQHNTDRIAIEVEECRSLGLEVLPPDVNESFATFTAIAEPDRGAPRRIRFGLNAIKNVGEQVVAAIIAERKASGPYLGLEDFLSRVRTKDLNRKSLESMAKSGALDGLCERNRVLGNIDMLLHFAKQHERAATNGQTNLFGMLPTTNAPTLKLREADAASDEQKLTWERELLGLFISSHPLRPHDEMLRAVATPIADCHHGSRNSSVRIGGLITSIKQIFTRTNEPMLFAKIEDLSGSLEVVVFPRVLAQRPGIWHIDRIVLLEGKLSDKDGVIKILANEAWEFSPDALPQRFRKQTATPPAAPTFSVAVPAKSDRSLFERLKTVFERYPGEARVVLTVAGERERRIVTQYRVAPTPELTRELETLLGANVVHHIRP